PSELGFDELGLRSGHDLGKQRYGCPQAPQPDADLVQRFRIAGLDSRFIGYDLRQAGPRDDAECLRDADARVQLDLSRFHRDRDAAVAERIAPFRLALERKPNRNAPGQIAREAKQFGRFAALELELELAARYRLPAVYGSRYFAGEGGL